MCSCQPYCTRLLFKFSSTFNFCVLGSTGTTQAGAPHAPNYLFPKLVELCPQCQKESMMETAYVRRLDTYLFITFKCALGEFCIDTLLYRVIFSDFQNSPSNHHFKVPPCPTCGKTWNLFHFNKKICKLTFQFVLRCENGHFPSLVDLCCQGESCNDNYTLKWFAKDGTMRQECKNVCDRSVNNNNCNVKKM